MQLHEVRERLLARADALGIEADTEEARLDALLEREVAVPPPTEAECRRYYAQHPELFRSGALVEADHILFAVTESTPLAALREKAEAVLQSLRAAPEGFAQAAAQFSNCPSGKVGGNLGQLSQCDVVPEFWRALDEFGETGLIARLVETRYGLHIVRVARRVDGTPMPFEAVRQQIAERLATHNLRLALRDYAHQLVHADDDGGHAH